MNPRRVITLMVALVAVAAIGWYFRSRVYGVDFVTASRPPTTTSSNQSAVANRQSAIPPSPAATDRSHLADELNSSAGDIRRDLQIVSDVLAAYRSNFAHDGNPWGDNQEITAQLTGKNRLHLALIPRDHVAVNAGGELCDRWGTPFFFHAESGTRMAIRSAGPDRKMWTGDDVVLEP